MNTTFSLAKLMVLRLLNDEEDPDSDYGAPLTGATYTAELLRDAIHAALNAITKRIGKPSVFTVEADYTPGDIPEDLISIEGVYDNLKGLFLPKISLRADKGVMISSETDNAWTDYPSGSITFVNDLPEEGATIYYSAGWDKPVDDDDFLEPPAYTLYAIILYAASWCLLQEASGSANVRQFTTKVDAGSPTDIPAKDMSDFFLKRYEVELQNLPAQERGTIR